MTGNITFCNKKLNWCAILENMMKDYLNARIYNQYEDCKKLIDFLATVTHDRLFC